MWQTGAKSTNPISLPADALVSQRGYPQPLNRTLGLGQLHDPPLDELSLLSGITAVDDAVGGGKEFLDGVEMFSDACVHQPSPEL